MIYRNYLGLDLQANALRAVSLRRQGKGASLTGGRLIGLDESVVVPSLRTPNILDIDRFTDALHEVVDPLAEGEQRLGLALPEQSGIQMLVDVESALKSRAEAVDIIKWQLRDKLPADLPLQLDYQVLHRDENGRQRLLVVCIAEDVLKQYEEVLNQAGYGAEQIGFRSMGLYSYYRQRLDTGENFCLLQVEEGIMTFQYYHAHLLRFHRSREVGLSVENVYRELNRSLAGERERLSGLQRSPVYLHCNWDNRDELLQALSALFEMEPVMLRPALDRLSRNQLNLTDKQELSLVTAVGTAERLM